MTTTDKETVERLADTIWTHERNLTNGFPMTSEVGTDMQKASLMIRALAAEVERLKSREPIRCAECDCEKGGSDCNWIAPPQEPVACVERGRIAALIAEHCSDCGPEEPHCKTADAILSALTIKTEAEVLEEAVGRLEASVHMPSDEFEIIATAIRGEK